MASERKDREELQKEIDDLRERLVETEETLNALRSAGIDALVVGEDVFILEAAGVESNRFRGEVLERINEAVIATDSEGHLVYMNEAAERQYRVRARDVLGQNFESVFSVRWPDPDDPQRALQELRSTGIWRGELTHILRDGTEFHAEVAACERRAGEGVAAGYFSVIRDISSRKKAEEEVKQRDERYRAFIEQSSEGIWRFELDEPIDTSLPVDVQIDLAFERGRLAECNDTMARQYGYKSCDEMIGFRISDLFVSEDPANTDFMQAFIESGYNLSEAESHEKDINGNDRYFLNTLVGVVENEKLVRVWGTQRDITGTKQTEKDRAHLAAIVEFSDDAIASKDLRGIITSWNRGATRIFGYTADEIVGKSVKILIPEELLDEETEILAKINRGESVDHYVTRRRRKDGTEFDVSLTVSPIRDPRGKIIGASKIARNITDEKRVERELREKQIMLSMAMKSSRMGAWELELQNGVVQWTEDLEQIFGLDPGTFGGTETAFFDLIHPDDRDSTWEAIQTALREHQDYNVEFRFIHADGSIRWMEGRGEAVYSDDDKPVRLYGIGVDITERRNAEEALRESEARFAKAFNSSPLAVTIAAVSTGKLIEINEAFSEFTGYTREDAIGRTIAELELWSEPVENRLNLETVGRDQGIRNREYRFRTKDAGEVIGLLSAEVLEIGGEHCVLAVIQDITQRKSLEEQLRSQNEILKAVTAGDSLTQILDKTALVIERRIPGSMTSILTTDASGTQLFCASAKSLPDEYNAAINGLQIGEKVGSCGTAASRRTPVVVSDISKSRLWEGYQELAESHGLRACWSHPIFSTSGKLLGTFATYFDHPRRPSGGDLRLLQSAVRAVGLAIERKQSEETLLELERRSAEEYQLLLARIVPLAEGLGAARDLHTIYRALRDFVGSSMSCSAFFVSFFDQETSRRLAAYACGDDGELDISQLPPIELKKDGGPNSKAVFERRSVITDSYMDEMRGRQHYILQENGLNPNSSLVVPMIVMNRVIGTLEVQAYPNNAFSQEDVVALEMVSNLAAVSIENVRLIETEATARQEAESANKMKDEFLSVLSHELRTPLNAMLGWVRMLRAGVLDAERTAKALEVIERNTRQQGSLIEDLLDVSRIISGKMRLEIGVVDIAPIMNLAADLVRPLAIAKDIQLNVNTENGPLLVNGDPVRLQQLITNLLQNAVKFTPSQGLINATAYRDDKAAKIIIEDNGVGIQKEFLPQIFDRFSQADASTRRNYTGLGLGLTIVRTIAELHGGNISVHSDGPDMGSVFAIEIPLINDLPESVESEKGQPEIVDTAQLAGLNILLVDDDVENLAPLKIFLELEKAIVTCARSVPEALEQLSSRDFELLISDIGMPASDGYELLEKVRLGDGLRNSQIAAIALTAYASDRDRSKALSSGYQAHLPKPVDFEKLLATICEVRNRNNGDVSQRSALAT